MLNKILLYSSIIFLLSSCSSLKTAFTGQKVTSNETAVSVEKKEVKFLNEISTPLEKPAVVQTNKIPETPVNLIAKPSSTATSRSVLSGNEISESSLEVASPLQVKYAVLLNTSLEYVVNTKMFEFIDEWYGTRYRLGGTTKRGIDCSAFSQFLFASVYGLTLPRTAREQYKLTNRISRTELNEGDLIFFNTRGGISHVGVYLQNNKFVHAASSEGVMISDIFDEYWVRRFIGVGRIADQPIIAAGQ